MTAQVHQANRPFSGFGVLQVVAGVGGADGDRTRDLVNAIHARGQQRLAVTRLFGSRPNGP